MNRVITTSWDDGHCLDLRLSDLLMKYGIKGTFYVPKYNLPQPIMSEYQLSILAQDFEIGGHSMTHTNLTKLSGTNLKTEVSGCFEWLKQIIDYEPVSFCPPFGKCNAEVLKVVYESGFKLVRTTELLSISGAVPVNSTTLQMFNHSLLTYTKHLMIRGRFTDLMLLVRNNLTSNLFKLIDIYIDKISTIGGVFHLWGHSWEIDKFDLWNQLEAMLKHLSNRETFSYVENKGLLKINPER